MAEPAVVVPKEPSGRRRLGAAIALLLVLSCVRSGAGLEALGAAPPAGDVLVTAGEHGEFSRVVFALGADLTYRTEPEPAGLRIVFPGTRVGFEYGGVYPARRAHRVVMAEPGLDADGASFRLGFGCDCSARTFMLDGRLVVDVFDVASSDGELSGSSRVAEATGPDVPATPGREADASAAPAARLAALRDVADETSPGQPRPEFLRRVESLSSSAQDASSGAVPDGVGFNPDHLQRMIDWAIDQGHLTGAAESDERASPPDGRENEQALAAGAVAPGSPPPGPAEQPARPAIAQEPAVAPEPPVAPEPSVALGSSVVAEPSIANVAADAASGTDGACPDGAALDMAVLGGSGTFAAELAGRQDALSRALAAGHGIPEAQHALAGFYLARLMPHEALRLLRTADRAAPTPTERWLEAVALVLADRTGTQAALQAWSCPGADIELWRAVLRAADGQIPGQTLASDAIRLRLAAYPPELRVELALRLAEAGIDAKASEAIARLLDMVEQAPPSEEARARLLFLRGRLAAARGDFAGARASWREALDLQGEGSLWATLALLESDLEHDELDEPWALSTLERLAYDWRGHAAQLSIGRLTAAIHERQGHVSQALRALEEVALGAEGRPSGRAAARLATDLMRRAYADAPSDLPIDQLAVLWRYEGFVPPGSEGADVRLAFAKALTAHGLPNSAVGLLEPLLRNTRGPVHDQVVDLLAEGYLATHQPASALDLLRAAAKDASAPKPRRNLLAARALAALGRFAEAAGVLHGDAGEEAAKLQADYLWKAGLWQEASKAYRALLEAPQGEPDPETADRLAAATYMADELGLLEQTHGEEMTGDVEAAGPASAPLPRPDSAASRAMAAQLLEQAADLSGLAERYGLGGAQHP
jgi:cellulose synthase operon protein C